MKAQRTSLSEDAVSGSVRSSVPWDAARQAPWDEPHAESDDAAADLVRWTDAQQAPWDAHEHAPWDDAQRDSWESEQTRPAAALRERLTQTRARIARSHAQPQPQIKVDWDPEEPPTRVYQAQALLSPRALAARARLETPENPLTTYALAQFHARVSQRPKHTPLVRESKHTNTGEAAAAAAVSVSAREAVASSASSITQRATAQLLAAQLPERKTPAPIASRVLREVSVIRERVNKLYQGLDRSDAALRRRVAFCSLALLVIAASSRMLFGGHPGARVVLTLSPADAQVTLDGAATSGEHNPRVLEGVTPGEHELSIQKAGFAAQRHKLTIGASVQEQPLSIKLVALPQSADIAISSDPPGALIYLNGRASSQVTPAKLIDVAPGRHMIALKLAGYADAKEALRVPGDTLVSIKLASLSAPRFAPQKGEEPTLTRAEQRAQARELARERRAAARAAKVLLRYRARMGLPPDPVAQELVEAYGPTQSAE